jgi:hypothetical protein
MNRPMAGVVWVAGLVLALAAGTAQAASWADGLFREAAHDFGPVPRGAKVRHSFVLTNRLTETITILDVRASCGCTTGRAGASTISPGQATVIEAEMDTRNFVGPKSTALFVSLVTASGRQAEVRLGVTSTILSDIVLNPGSIDFGTVVKGQAPQQVLSIERVGDLGWKAERMISASRVLDASLRQTARSAAGVSYTLTVSLKPGAPAGAVRDEIRVLTNDPQSPSIPVLVTAQIRGDLSASPSVLALGDIAKEGGQGRVLIRASQPFAIVGIEGAGDGFQVGPADASRKPVHVLTISYRPEQGTTRGDLRRSFRVLTDLPGEPPLELTATLHVAP